MALFFAAENPKNGPDSAVWCYAHTGDDFDKSVEPLEIRDVVVFEPPHVSSRIAAQASRFTVHPRSIIQSAPAWHGILFKIVILSDARAAIREQLDELGVHRGALFPGLDGIAARVNARFSE